MFWAYFLVAQTGILSSKVLELWFYQQKPHNERRGAAGQEDDYTTTCLFDQWYFKENYKLIAIDLSKYAFNADPKAIPAN